VNQNTVEALTLHHRYTITTNAQESMQ